MISNEQLLTRLRSIQSQLADLEADLAQSVKPDAKAPFSSLRGAFKGQFHCDDADIEAVKYRVPDPDTW